MILVFARFPNKVWIKKEFSNLKIYENNLRRLTIILYVKINNRIKNYLNFKLDKLINLIKLFKDHRKKLLKVRKIWSLIVQLKNLLKILRILHKWKILNSQVKNNQSLILRNLVQIRIVNNN